VFRAARRRLDVRHGDLSFSPSVFLVEQRVGKPIERVAMFAQQAHAVPHRRVGENLMALDHQSGTIQLL
jgi:hypothetical protein